MTLTTTVTISQVITDLNTLNNDIFEALGNIGNPKANQNQNWGQVISDLGSLLTDIGAVASNPLINIAPGTLANIVGAKSSCQAIINQFSSQGLASVNANKLFTCISTTSGIVGNVATAAKSTQLATGANLLGVTSQVAANFVSPNTTLGNIGNNVSVYLNNATSGELQFSDIAGSLQATVIPASGNNTSPTVNISGQSNNPLDINNANINISSKSSVQVYGVGDDLNINSGSAILLNGTSNIINANNSQVTLGADASATVTGSGNIISVGAGASLTVNSGSGSNAINGANHYANQNQANDWHWLSDMLINTVAA